MLMINQVRVRLKELEFLKEAIDLANNVRRHTGSYYSSSQCQLLTGQACELANGF